MFKKDHTSTQSTEPNITVTPPAQSNQKQKEASTNKANNANSGLNTVKKQQIVNTAGKVGKSHHQYLKIMAQQKGVANYRKITYEQLSKHKSKEEAWLSLNGVVYDVTIYLNYHPGGSILLEGCGKQCSQLFNQYHPWVNAKYLLEKYRIGYVGH